MASYFLVESSWLRSKEYEFEGINKRGWETDCSVVVVILCVKSLIRMKGNEFGIISLLDNVVHVYVFGNMLVLEEAHIGNSVTTFLSQTLLEKGVQMVL